MKVLYLPFLYGSAALVSYDITTRLSKRNQVVVIPSGICDQKNVARALRPIGSLPDRLVVTFPIPQLIRGIEAAKRLDPDAIISQYHPSDMISYIARMISRAVRKPLLVRSDDIWFVPFGRFSLLSELIHRLNCSVIKDSTFFLVNSTEHKLMIEKIYHRHEGVIVHPNGVDTKRFNPNLTGREVRRKLGLEDKKVILYSGGGSWFRGLELLPKAFAIVAKEIKDARLVFVGFSRDQIHKEVVLKEIERQSMKNKTLMIPPVPYMQIQDFIALGDVCIGTLCSLPVNIGTVPTKVPQYMACGKPTIVAKGGVSKDLIIHKKTGIAFTGDHRSLARWIMKLIEDQSFAKAIGREARSHVEKNYNWDTAVFQLEELVRHACRNT